VIAHLSEVFRVIIIMSLSGGALALLVIAVKPLVRFRLPWSVQYYLWLVVLAALLVPMSRFVVMPEMPNFTLAPIHAVVERVERMVASGSREESSLQMLAPHEAGMPANAIGMGAQQPSPAKDGAPAQAGAAPAESTAALTGIVRATITEAPEIASEAFGAAASGQPAQESRTQESRGGAWLTQEAALASFYPLTVFAILMYNVLCYARFTGKVRRSRTRASSEELRMLSGICGKFATPQLYHSRSVTTPMLVGILRPAVILPDREYAGAELRSILLHEITHLRRRDILVKWLSVIACALHWFNPVVWLARREIDRNCELSCDEAVMRMLDADGRQSYGDTLITVAADTKKQGAVLSTTLSSKKKDLRERLSSIMKYKARSRAIKMVSIAVLAMTVFMSAVLGAGAAAVPQAVIDAGAGAEEKFPEDQSAYVYSGDRGGHLEHETVLQGLPSGNGPDNPGQQLWDASGTDYGFEGKQFAVGEYGNRSAFVISPDGTLWSSGNNEYGQLGDGTTEDSKNSIFYVKVMDDAVSVATGMRFTMALKADGSVWSWGYNASGQLGDGTTTDRTSPVKVMDGAVAILAYSDVAMAVKADGSLWGWGSNERGQLGLGDNNNRLFPVQIAAYVTVE